MPAFWAGLLFCAGVAGASALGWPSLASAVLGLLCLRWPRVGLLSLFLPLGSLCLILAQWRFPDDIRFLRDTNLLILAEPLDTNRVRVLGVWEDEPATASGVVVTRGPWLSSRNRYLLSGHLGPADSFRIVRAMAVEKFPVFSPVRAWITGKLRRASSSGENLGLSVGFLLGNRSMIPRDLKEAFRKTGLMHLLAISGLHVGLLFLIMLTGLAGARVPRAWAVGLAGGALWPYALLVGASPSVIRASIFVSVFALAYIVGRRRNHLNTLGVALLATLLVNPLWLFDIGFQLSYAATFGILYYLGDARLPASWAGKWLLGPVLVTLAAQVFVAPLLLRNFGALSLWAFPLNILAVPLLGLIIAEWVLFFLFMPLGLGAPFAALANAGLDLLRLLVYWASSLGPLQIRMPGLSWWAMALWWGAALAAKPGLIFLRERWRGKLA